MVLKMSMSIELHRQYDVEHFAELQIFLIGECHRNK